MIRGTPEHSTTNLELVHLNMEIKPSSETELSLALFNLIQQETI